MILLYNQQVRSLLHSWNFAPWLSLAFCAVRGHYRLLTPPPPLSKHTESEENDGQTGSRCLDKEGPACDVRYQQKVCHRDPAHT